LSGRETQTSPQSFTSRSVAPKPSQSADIRLQGSLAWTPFGGRHCWPTPRRPLPAASRPAGEAPSSPALCLYGRSALRGGQTGTTRPLTSAEPVTRLADEGPSEGAALSLVGATVGPSTLRLQSSENGDTIISASGAIRTRLPAEVREVPVSPKVRATCSCSCPPSGQAVDARHAHHRPDAHRIARRDRLGKESVMSKLTKTAPPWR
jgi:hypothetical protein